MLDRYELLIDEHVMNLEYQYGGDDFKIKFWMRDPVLWRSVAKAARLELVGPKVGKEVRTEGPFYMTKLS